MINTVFGETMQTLYTSLTTPYGRIILMIAYQKNVELALTFAQPWENPNHLTAVNPFSQVPALVWENGEVVTETPLIIHAIAPEVLTDNSSYNLPRIAKALGILSQGVRAYSTELFGKGVSHPFVGRSQSVLQDTLPKLPILSADSDEWGDKILLCALAWIAFRLPECFAHLSPENQQAVKAFEQSDVMQKTSSDALQLQPKKVSDL